MRMLAALVTLVFVAGCGGNDPAAPPPTVTLAQACPQIEAALIADASAKSVEWSSTLKVLRDIREAADPETQNAIDLLRPTIEGMVEQRPEARTQFRATVNTVSARCRAAGSTAFM